MHPVAFQPISRHRFAPRHDIISRVVATPRPALVVFHGAAGIGKSTAMGQVAEALAGDGARAVWIRLSADDRGDDRFWRHMLSTMSAAGVTTESTLLAELREGGFVDRAQFGAIGAELAAIDEPIVIAFDDFHLAATASIEDGLIELLAAAHNVTALVATRSPGRLTTPGARARIPIASVTGDDLTFTREQTRALVALRLPGLRDDEVDAVAAAVHDEARGWAIATMALIEAPGDAPANAPVAARSRANARVFVRDHVDRMLHSATPQERDLLLRTSLIEEISPALAMRLSDSGIDDDTAAEALVRLESVTSRVWDDEHGQRWYRHHDLIREELLRRARAQLDEATIADLYARVIDDLIDTRPQLAAQVAFDAKDWERFGEILTITFSETLHAVGPAGDDRIRRIPRSELDQHVALQAVALIYETMRPRNQVTRVVSGLRLLAGSSLRALSTQPGVYGVLALGVRMAAARFAGNIDAAVDFARRCGEGISALSEADLARYGATIATLMTQKAATYLYAEDFDEADRALRSVIDDPAQPSVAEVAHAHALLALSAAWRGRMHEAAAAIDACERTPLPVGWRTSFFGSSYRIAKGLVLLDQGDAPGAMLVRSGLDRFESDLEAWPLAAMVEALAIEAATGPVEALAALERARSRHRTGLPVLPAFQHQMNALRARLQWQSGAVAPAGRRASAPSLASAYALASRGDWGAVAIIASALSGAGQPPRRRADAMLLQAAAALHLGDERGAVEHFVHADCLMSEHGLRTPLRSIAADDVAALVRHAAELRPERTIDARGGDAASISTKRVRPLSAAERRALEAVYAHGSVRAAAEALFISPETVRDHLKSIHRKLGVHSRADAIAAAMELGYLGGSSQGLSTPEDIATPE